MKKRMLLMLAGIVMFVGAIGTVKYKQVQKSIAQNAAFHMPPETVTTVVARSERWSGSLSAVGTVVAVHGVTVSADLPGIVARIAFDSGRMVRAGEVLIELDTRQEQAQLAAAQAQLELARLNLDRMRRLSEQGVAPKADYDRLEAEGKEADARVGEIRATIERKTIRAPFTGVLGIRKVNLGQYLDGGGAIVSLESLDPIYVNFSVPQQEVARLTRGSDVRVATEASGGELKGKVTAIDSLVDEATRNVAVQATFANSKGKLHPGMYATAIVSLGTASNVIAIPTSSISYAPYGDSVFVVEIMKGPKGESYRGVRQQFVKLGGGRGDQIAVLSGLKPGDEVVTSGVFKLRQGAAVQVNNTTQPSNNPSPRPEDS